MTIEGNGSLWKHGVFHHDTLGFNIVFSVSYENLEMLENKTHGKKVEENRHLFEHKIWISITTVTILGQRLICTCANNSNGSR